MLREKEQGPDVRRHPTPQQGDVPLQLQGFQGNSTPSWTRTPSGHLCAPYYLWPRKTKKQKSVLSLKYKKYTNPNIHKLK